MNWALLAKPSKAIFPVIACYCNKRGVAFPGERTIAILSGLSDKVVRKGVRGLESFPGFSWEYYKFDRTKRSKRFSLELPKNSQRDSFPFYQVVLEYGLWRTLKLTAKALYPVMRCFSYFDLDEYLDIEGDEDSCYADFDEVFKNRKYDFSKVDHVYLAGFSGIHRNSINGALNSLEANYLIERDSRYGLWKVYLQSKNNTYWKRDFLNKKIEKSYGHVFNSMHKNYR